MKHKVPKGEFFVIKPDIKAFCGLVLIKTAGEGFVIGVAWERKMVDSFSDAGSGFCDIFSD